MFLSSTSPLVGEGTTFVGSMAPRGNSKGSTARSGNGSGSSTTNKIMTLASMAIGSGSLDARLHKNGDRNLLQEARQASAGYSANEKELVTQFTTFTDTNCTSADPINSHYFDLAQGWVGQEAAASAPLTRPKKVEVWALPRASNAQVAASTYVASTGVLGLMGQSGAHTLNNVRNTVIKPDFNIEWIKILSYDVDSLFRNTEFLPLIISGAQELFRISIINPDTGAVDEEPIQLMIRVTCAQVQPVVQEVKAITQTASTWTAISAVVVEPQFCMSKLLRLQNLT